MHEMKISEFLTRLFIYLRSINSIDSIWIFYYIDYSDLWNFTHNNLRYVLITWLYSKDIIFSKTNSCYFNMQKFARTFLRKTWENVEKFRESQS